MSERYEDELSAQIANGIFGCFFGLVGAILAFLVRLIIGAFQSSGYHKPQKALNVLQERHAKYDGHVITQQTSSWPSIQIRVRRDTRFYPQQLLQLMQQFFALGVALRLSIRVTKSSIGWYVEAPESRIEAVKRIVRAFYPYAEFEDGEAISDVGFFHFTYEGLMPCPFPLALISDFDSDPLRLVTSCLDICGDRDEILYQLLLQPPKHDYHQIATEALTQGNVHILHYLTEDGAQAANHRKRTGQDRQNAFGDYETEFAFEKLQVPRWMEARLDVKFKYNDKQRALDDALDMNGTLEIFQRERVNSLVISLFDEAFPLVLTAGEAAALWHMPTDNIVNDKIARL